MEQEQKHLTSQRLDTNFKELLSNLIIEKEITLVYTNKVNLDKFLAGTIEMVCDDGFIINHLESNGTYDGYLLKEIQEIIKIERKTEYADKLKKLGNYYHVSHNTVECINNSAVNSLLLFAMKNKLIVSIGILDSGYYDLAGFVTSIDGVNISIALVNDFGYKDGECYINSNDVTAIACDGSDEIALKILYDINYSGLN